VLTTRHGSDAVVAAVEAGRQREALDDACLATDLARIRRRGLGFAVGDGEACVGAPVLDPRGRRLGAVALLTTPRRLRRDLEHFAITAQQTAARVARLPAARPRPG
jgi:DNA-binding IclR family transcriptional regulator